MRIVFMGTAPFAVPCLRRMVADGYQVPAVVSQPDRPRGRGMQLIPTPIHAAADELGLPLLQPEMASEVGFAAALAALAPDLAVVVAYGQILKPAVLAIPRLGCINVHGSLLPELRGAAPIQWAVLRGYRETGVTTMWMDAGMDTGDMILQAREPIRSDDTGGVLTERLSLVGADLLGRTLALIDRGEAPRTRQDAAAATYAPMLQRNDGAVNWDWPAEAIRNHIHGCNPAPGAFARRAGHTVKLWRAEVAPGGGLPGVVLSACPLVVAAGTGAVRLLELQAQNRGRSGGEEFARGYRVQPGEVWKGGGAEH